MPAKSGYVSFGDMVRKRLDMQAQYACHYLFGMNGRPNLGRELLYIGNANEYQQLLIHQDDIEEFVYRMKKHRASLKVK